MMPFCLQILVFYELLPGATGTPVESSAQNNDFFLNIVFTITVIVMSFAAFAIFKFVKSLDASKQFAEPSLKKPQKVDIESAISSALSDASLTKKQYAAIGTALKKTIETEIAKTVDIASEEITSKFENVIKEKDSQYNTVTKKYKETLGEKKQTESVIRSIAEGLVILNDKGEVIMLNPAAEKLLGISDEQRTGKPIGDFIKNEQMLSLVKRREDTGESEIELNAQNEETKKVIRSSTAVIQDENGQTIGMVSVLTDITKQRELDALKSKFFSTVTHELRSPIIALRNSISLILNKSAGPLTAEQQNLVEITDRNLGRLRLLIDDILDFSKLEQSALQITKIPSSIEKVITEVCDTFKAWADTKQINISKEVQRNMPEIRFDPDRITQVLSNIVSNAIKVTAKNGSIKINVGLQVRGGKREILVAISDTGIGISKEDIPKLFKRYQQLKSDVSMQVNTGAGLGLYVSKELVELHGGRIWAESEVNKGSTFNFTIPAEES